MSAQRPVRKDHGSSRPAAESSLRLTLADAGVPFTGGRFLAPLGPRLSAAACDVGVIAAVGVGLFVVLDRFWMPFCVSTLLYYVVGILLLGNTPGVCLFAPAPEGEESRRRGKKTRAPGRPPARALDTELESLPLLKRVRSGLAHAGKTLCEAARLMPSLLRAISSRMAKARSSDWMPPRSRASSPIGASAPVTFCTAVTRFRSA